MPLTQAGLLRSEMRHCMCPLAGAGVAQQQCYQNISFIRCQLPGCQAGAWLVQDQAIIPRPEQASETGEAEVDNVARIKLCSCATRTMGDKALKNLPRPSLTHFRTF